MAEIAGLTLITPSSVAGTGVSLSGAKVTFTAATSVSVNGCFSSTYDNYLIVLRATTSLGANIQSRLRASGSDASGSDYTTQNLLTNDTSISGVRFSDTYANIATSNSASVSFGSHIYYYGPYLAQTTIVRATGVNQSAGARTMDYLHSHSLSTAYDGFTFYPSSGNTTGTLTIYGLSQ